MLRWFYLEDMEFCPNQLGIGYFAFANYYFYEFAMPSTLKLNSNCQTGQSLSRSYLYMRIP